MKSESIVSIIIPAFNIEQRIKKCITSALAQTYTNIEVIVIDDGSTDYTLKYAREFLSDNRVRIETQPNGGVSSARNKGLSIAIGEWIAFVDADDTIANTYIEDMLSIATSETDVVICAEKREGIEFNLNVDVYEGAQEIGNLIGHRHRDTGLCLITPWGKIIKRTLIEKYSIKFCEEFNIGEDTLFVLECYNHSNQIKCLHKPLYEGYKIQGSLSDKGSAGIKAVEPMVQILHKKIEIFKEKDIYSENSEVNRQVYVSMKNIIVHTVYSTRINRQEIKNAISEFTKDDCVQMAAKARIPLDWQEKILSFVIRHKCNALASAAIMMARGMVRIKRK